jgi:hypothetical protein
MAYNPKFEKHWLRVWHGCPRNRRFLVETGDPSLPKHPDCLWGPTGLYLVSTSSFFSVSKVAGMGKCSLLSNTKV